MQGSAIQHEVITVLRQKASDMHISAACMDSAAELEQPADVLQKLARQQTSGLKAAVVCAPAQADWTLQSEMAYLDSLSTATKAAYPHNVMAYLSDSSAQVATFNMSS